MEMKVKWEAPVALRKPRDGGRIYECDLDSVPDSPGLYLFARRSGTKVVVIYVGRSNSIRTRVAQQLNAVRLMMHMYNAPAGARMVIPGSFILGASQTPEKCLPILEQAIIDHCMDEGHNLVNINGTRLDIKDIINSSGSSTKDLIPRIIHLV